MSITRLLVLAVCLMALTGCASNEEAKIPPPKVAATPPAGMPPAQMQYIQSLQSGQTKK